MQTLLQFFVQILTALTGAIGIATLWAGAASLLGGAGAIGSGWLARRLGLRRKGGKKWRD